MKILSIDGGGIRGVIPAIILSHIEEISGKPISELFDLIAGTSTGGLLALGLTVDNGKGQAKYSAADLVDLYQDHGKDIFDRGVWHRMRSIGNIAEEKYPSEGFQKVLKKYFGQGRLSETISDVLIPAYETERRIPWFFKSSHAKNPNKKLHDYSIIDVALATSAAPTYFEPHKIEHRNNDHLSLIDGGIFCNNPAMSALVEARSTFDCNEDDITLVSLGTGQLTRRLYHDEIKRWGLIQWAQPVLSCVFDGVSDSVDYQMRKMLSNKQYYRFQIELAKGNDDMDDASNTNLRVLRLLAEDIIRNNKAALNNLAYKLSN